MCIKLHVLAKHYAGQILNRNYAKWDVLYIQSNLSLVATLWNSQDVTIIERWSHNQGCKFVNTGVRISHAVDCYDMVSENH